MVPRGKSWTLLVAVIATVLVNFKAEGFNACLQKEEGGVLVPADACTPDADGALEGLYDCGITDEDHDELAACLSVNPSAIIDLSLGENNLSSVPEGLFAEMRNLKDLSFYLNRGIRTFPVGAFAGLRNLRHMDMGWMGLESLPAGLFDDTPKLQTLYMGEQNNGLTELPEGLFEGLTRLRTLGLGVNKLTTLPAGIFSTNTRLTRISLSDNQITSLPETVFNGLERLHQISITQNNRPGPEDDARRVVLTEIPAGLFKGILTLKRLSLRGNLLTTLPEGVFSDNLKLKRIDVSNNELVELPDDTFVNLPKLEELDLIGNIDLQCKYEVDDTKADQTIEWPEQLDGLTGTECLP